MRGRRALAALAAALTLATAACAGPARPTIPAETAFPPPAPPPEPQPRLPDGPLVPLNPPPVAMVPPDRLAHPDGLVGMSRDEVTQRLGAPAFTRNEGAAQVWRFDGTACFLDVFLYRDGEDFRVRHVAVRAPSVARADPVACFRELARSPEPRRG